MDAADPGTLRIEQAEKNAASIEGLVSNLSSRVAALESDFSGFPQTTEQNVVDWVACATAYEAKAPNACGSQADAGLYMQPSAKWCVSANDTKEIFERIDKVEEGWRKLDATASALVSSIPSLLSRRTTPPAQEGHANGLHELPRGTAVVNVDASARKSTGVLADVERSENSLTEVIAKFQDLQDKLLRSSRNEDVKPQMEAIKAQLQAAQEDALDVQRAYQNLIAFPGAQNTLEGQSCLGVHILPEQAVNGDGSVSLRGDETSAKEQLEKQIAALQKTLRAQEEAAVQFKEEANMANSQAVEAKAAAERLRDQLRAAEAEASIAKDTHEKQMQQEDSIAQQWKKEKEHLLQEMYKLQEALRAVQQEQDAKADTTDRKISQAEEQQWLQEKEQLLREVGKLQDEVGKLQEALCNAQELQTPIMTPEAQFRVLQQQGTDQVVAKLVQENGDLKKRLAAAIGMLADQRELHAQQLTKLQTELDYVVTTQKQMIFSFQDSTLPVGSKPKESKRVSA